VKESRRGSPRRDAQELAQPGRPGAAPVDPGALEDLPSVDAPGMPYPGQLAVESAGTPGLVPPCQAPHPRTGPLPVAVAAAGLPPAASGRPTGGGRCRGAPQEVPGVTRSASPRVGRSQRPGRSGPAMPVRPRQPGASPLPLAQPATRRLCRASRSGFLHHDSRRTGRHRTWHGETTRKDRFIPQAAIIHRRTGPPFGQARTPARTPRRCPGAQGFRHPSSGSMDQMPVGYGQRGYPMFVKDDRGIPHS